jgi:hypothetical protein
VKSPIQNEATRLLRDSVLWHQPQSFRRSLLYLMLVVLASVLVAPGRFVVDGKVFTDGHALASLELAMARAYCGPPSSFSSTIRIPFDVRDHMELRTVSLRTLVERKAGTVEDYCRSVRQPFVNNENSLMLLETAILRVWPGMSVSQMGEALHLIKIATVGVFVLLLIDLGASLLFAAGLLLWSVTVLLMMQDQIYSNYPFVFVTVLALAAFYGFALKYRWARGSFGLALSALAAGVLSAFMANMRTSYLPVAMLFVLCFVVADLTSGSAPIVSRIRAMRAAAFGACFVVGYAALQYGMITRFLQPEASHVARHTIGHPLVLSISVPENEFSRREGITWLDEVGRQKALSVDPTAAYLGPKYDGALLRYYANLWKSYPRDMLRLYGLKFSVAGMDMIGVLRGSPGLDGRIVHHLLTPVSHLPNGLWLFALYLAAATGTMALFLISGSVAAFIAALLSGAAVLAHIEAGVIYSLFIVHYHNYLIFYVVFLSAAVLQAAVNAGWWLVSGRRAALPA